MRQAYRILPVYAGDVSGVNSALYELGGMVVMHDPSGCNSTYNTHDETRWYDRDSLIFLSGLNDYDAILGNDEKFIHDIVEAAKTYRPRFIALTTSPIPYLNGTDFAAIRKIVEQRTGIPTFHVGTSGMHDYVYGENLAFVELAKLLFANEKNEVVRGEPDVCKSMPMDANIRGAEECTADRIRVNILGMTPLDFAAETSVQSLKCLLEARGLEVVSCWAMGAQQTPGVPVPYEESMRRASALTEELLRSPSADVNLLLSSTAAALADFLKERFGIPYVAGVPVGSLADEVCEAIRTAQKTGENQRVCMRRVELDSMASGKENESSELLALIGEPIVMGSLAAWISRERQVRCRVIAPTEGAEKWLAAGDVRTRGEEEVIAALRGADTVIADPLYQLVCEKNVRFIRLPHLAFSGRIYLNEMRDLFRAGDATELS